MAPSGPDASNSCLPPSSPVVISCPPIPSTTRGERCNLDGKGGRLLGDKPILCYASGKTVVARTLDGQALLPDHTPLPTLCYRGHNHPVTALQLAPTGAYMASADERGRLRIWAFDHEEHLCKYDSPGLTGPIRDLAWDGESKKVCLGGERDGAAGNSDCAKVLQWDTGVSVGQLAQHLKGRVASVAVKPNRPFRIVTAGKDDTRTYFHKGPPFGKIPAADGIPCESAHEKGMISCIRYSHAGTWVVSVGADRAICVYDGKTLELKHKLEQVHTATIYSVAWSGDDQHIMTASGDGTCKLFAVDAATGVLKEEHTWNPAEHQNKGEAYEKVPVGGIQLGCTFVQGTKPVSVGLNGQIALLPPAGSADKDMEIWTGHDAPMGGIAVDWKNQRFYTGDSDGILCEWDATQCKPLRRIEPSEGNADLQYICHGGAVADLACLASGTTYSVGWDDKLVVSVNGKAQLNPLALGAQPRAIDAGSKVAVVATVQGLVVVPNESTLGSMVSTSYDALSVCVTPDDKTVYVGGSDFNIHIYEITNDHSLKEKHVIENGHLKPITALSLSPDGTKLAAGDQRDVCVFDLNADYKAVIGKGRWCFHVQKVTCLSWAPDSQVLASGGADNSIYLWSIAKKMKRIHYPYAHKGGLTGLEFAPEQGSYKFVSVGADSVVNLWDVSKDVADKFA